MKKNLLPCVIAFYGLIAVSCSDSTDKINRKELVNRHKILIDSVNILNPLTVGNGKFAYTVDFTGLQTFPSLYESGIPLGTQSEWGWHSYPNTMDYKFEETLEDYNYHGRQVPFSVQIRMPERKREAVNYFRQNPHRLHLGVIGLDLTHPDGKAVTADEINEIHQTLNPWNGEIASHFKIADNPVTVTTFVHQDLDLISASISSPLIEQGLLRIKISFPYPTGQHTDSGCDWNEPERHFSEIKTGPGSASIKRSIDDTTYEVKLEWSTDAEIEKSDKHIFYLKPGRGKHDFSFSCLFSEEPFTDNLPDYHATEENNKVSWKSFWLSGGAVDLSGSTNPRAPELERRIILSQYLTKVQCAGAFPPSETGLTFNSWHGKFHLEMHYWHGIHYALWDRAHLLEQSLDYYGKIIPKAKETAERQGFEGLRWPKMTDPSGTDSPSGVGSFLIWQQPHIIYMAELCYRNSPNNAILRKYMDVVFGAADFMASFAWYDSETDRYLLGPPLIPAQERFPAETTFNSPFELAYWQWCLNTACEWKERLNLSPVSKWTEVSDKLSPLPQKDGLYLSAESAPDSYQNPRFISDHPMVTGTFGMLPNSPLIDYDTMKNTFEYVWDNWQWSDTWGWDFPMTAMAASRLGMPGKAIDALFKDTETNTWLLNGHNYQNQRLKIYLPGNGALLAAIAMMCAGWENGPDTDTPGFPDDGTWTVKWEGLKKLP